MQDSGFRNSRGRPTWQGSPPPATFGAFNNFRCNQPLSACGGAQPGSCAGWTTFSAHSNFWRTRTTLATQNNSRRPGAHNLKAVPQTQLSEPTTTFIPCSNFGCTRQLAASGGSQPGSCSGRTPSSAYIISQQLWPSATTFGGRGLVTWKLHGKNNFRSTQQLSAHASRGGARNLEAARGGDARGRVEEVEVRSLHENLVTQKLLTTGPARGTERESSLLTTYWSESPIPS